MSQVHGASWFSRLPNFPRSFQSKYLIGSRKSRTRQLNPKLLFQTMLELVAGTNGEGYLHALSKSFGFPSKSSALKIPTKSALCQRRARVSYKFFRDLFLKLIDRFEPYRKSFRGFRIYAIDGLELTLPRTQSVLKSKFRGRAVSSNREMYYPRMYLTHCYDVLSGTTKDFRHSPLMSEMPDAEEMVPELEKNSITLYDRFYISKRMISVHKMGQNYFIMRARQGHLKEIQTFFESPKMRTSIVIEGALVHLIKIKNPHSNEFAVFATNLPRDWVKSHLIEHLYALRWEVETSFKDLVCTLKLEQWHSKTINGILQELYSAFWLLNFTKIQLSFHEKTPKSPLQWEYSKPNLKLILSQVIGSLSKIFKRVCGVLNFIPTVINFSTERRKRYSRRYNRELKTSSTTFPYNNTLWCLSA